jgi:class 3 adenylate cyclase
MQKPDINKLVLPELQTTETVVLFADISGFTNISEACASMGVRGNEELAFCINRYMEGMVKSLGKYGGDIIKFVGDAMIVMWPRVADQNQLEDKITVVRKAIQCAWDIQNELNNKKIMTTVTNLSVKIGIGFGECALLYVGGIFNRSEFFTVGDALT